MSHRASMTRWLKLTPESPDQAAEGPFADLYRRLGSRYITVLLVAGALSIPALSIPVAALAVPYLDISAGKFAVAIAGCVPWFVLVGAVAYRVGLGRALRPLQAWLRGGRGSAGAKEAWDASVHDLAGAAFFGGAITAVGALPAAIFVPSLAGADIGVYVAAVGVVWISVAVGAGLHYLIWEQALRPVVLDLAEQLPATFRVEKRTVSLAIKLMVLVPLVSFFCAIVTAGFASADLSSTGKLAVGLAVGLGVTVFVAVPLTMMFARSVLVPLQRLLTAMGNVERGDLDARLPIVGADEVGTIAEHFNSMLGGLKDRERLSGENEQLQEQVRAQLDEVRASRARIIAASDAERRRVERNIHDGAQQRLVALALKLRMAEAKAASEDATPELREELKTAGDDLSGALGELRELARGLHPQILSTDGLRPALEQLGSRASVPVEVKAPDDRFSDPVESTAYFVVSEALANVGKYAQASQAEVNVERRNGALHVAIEDDGVGGADPDSGSGLSGLKDRVAALDGSLEVESDTGRGTKVRAELPL